MDIIQRFYFIMKINLGLKQKYIEAVDKYVFKKIDFLCVHEIMYLTELYSLSFELSLNFQAD